MDIKKPTPDLDELSEAFGKNGDELIKRVSRRCSELLDDNEESSASDLLYVLTKDAADIEEAIITAYMTGRMAG